jgi:cell division protein FtsW
MANDVRKRSTNKGNTQKDISRTRINRQAKKKQQNYIKAIEERKDLD